MPRKLCAALAGRGHCEVGRSSQCKGAATPQAPAGRCSVASGAFQGGHAFPSAGAPGSAAAAGLPLPSKCKLRPRLYLGAKGACVGAGGHPAEVGRLYHHPLELFLHSSRPREGGFPLLTAARDGRPLYPTVHPYAQALRRVTDMGRPLEGLPGCQRGRVGHAGRRWQTFRFRASQPPGPRRGQHRRYMS